MTPGTISRVEKHSPEWDAGVRPGDRLLSINSQPVRDVLEYSYLCGDTLLRMKVRRGDRDLDFDIRMRADCVPGLEFDEDLFDGVHTCKNSCIFCFLHQMPPGLRDTLYVRDDDYRLSLAHGNYITLTNVSDEAMDRICSQRMSPIYISVHATDPDLRQRMIRNKAAGRIMEQLRRLADARITMHTQIVLCPSINDGAELEHTVHDLAALYPWVASIGVVPVGLTKFREGLYPLRAFESGSSREVVRMCRRWQREFLLSHGSRIVWPSDEFYLQAGMGVPVAGAYEDFPQIENGIGLARVFLDELKSVKRSLARRPLKAAKYVLVTGVLAAPLVQQLADAFCSAGVPARVCIARNRFFGESVTVAGLLTSMDIADALGSVDADEEALIPDIMLNEGRFLDDLTVADIEPRCKGRIRVVPSFPKGMLRSLRCATSNV